DGIRDKLVTGVQTCALPISRWSTRWKAKACSAKTAIQDRSGQNPTSDGIAQAGNAGAGATRASTETGVLDFHPVSIPRSNGNRKIGRASCRERVYISVGAVT